MDFVQVEGRSFFDLSLLTLGVGNVGNVDGVDGVDDVVRLDLVLAMEVAVS